MSKKKIIIILAITTVSALVVFRVVNYLNYKITEQYVERHYIFDKDFPGIKKTSASNNTLLADGTATETTLELFQSLQQRFAVKSIRELDEHFNEVGKYLDARLSASDASRLFDIYKKYMECMIELEKKPKYRIKTTDPKLILILLYKIQNFRRARLGKETADALFGEDVKEREYLLRKALIIGDRDLYGGEKEKRLQTLKNDMWGSKKIFIAEDSNPYNRYQCKMSLYQKDLYEMTEEDRQIKIEEFKKEFFSDEQLKRMHEVDLHLAEEKENLERYRAAEKMILDSEDMSEEEKEKMIVALQKKFFGKYAEAFRRREIMYGRPHK